VETTVRGDDGTRTHDPLLANTPDLDGGERWRTTLPDQRGSADRGERWRTAADVRQMFDRSRRTGQSQLEKAPFSREFDRSAVAVFRDRVRSFLITLPIALAYVPPSEPGGDTATVAG
jgi:hypothetical protein